MEREKDIDLSDYNFLTYWNINQAVSIWVGLDPTQHTNDEDRRRYYSIIRTEVCEAIESGELTANVTHYDGIGLDTYLTDYTTFKREDFIKWIRQRNLPTWQEKISQYRGNPTGEEYQPKYENPLLMAAIEISKTMFDTLAEDEPPPKKEEVEAKAQEILERENVIGLSGNAVEEIARIARPMKFKKRF